MKKLFLFAAMMATILLTACGGSGARQKSVNSLPEDLQDFVWEMNSMIERKLSDDVIHFEKTVVEDNNLVCLFTFNEDNDKGMNLRQFLKYEVSEQSIYDEFVRQLNKRCNTEVLREYKYNVIVRFTGSKSKYVKDIKIS